MSIGRREFLKGTAWMGGAALAAGCHLNRLGFGEGGVMQNYAYRNLMGRRVRVGFVGIGSRGSGAVHRVSMIPGVDIVALCDKKPERVRENLKWLSDKKYPVLPKSYVGDEAYKDLCDFGECDVVYCATPWALHQPVALRALNGGKIALVEVTSALTTEECWELVEASEKYRLPCMQLENCVYGEIELLELNLARLGMFGEINHAEGAYIHDLRAIIPSVGKTFNSEWEWRYDENMAHAGNRYPTHGLVPICQTLGVNRGDRLDYLVSLECGPGNANYELVKKEILSDADPRKKDPPPAMGAMNTTLIKTVKGKSIVIQHDVSSPRPYSRIQLISGTKGIASDYPFRCTFEKKCMEERDYKMPDGRVFKVGALHHIYQRTIDGYLIFYDKRDFLVFFTMIIPVLLAMIITYFATPKRRLDPVPVPSTYMNKANSTVTGEDKFLRKTVVRIESSSSGGGGGGFSGGGGGGGGGFSGGGGGRF